MNDRNKRMKMFHNSCQEELKTLDGKRYYAVSEWGNVFVFVFVLGFLGAITFMPLNMLFKTVYQKLGLISLTNGGYTLSDWKEMFVVMGIVGLIMAVISLGIITLERIYVRLLNRISAVIDDSGMTAEVVDLYDSYSASRIQRFGWEEIESISYEFNFPRKYSSKPNSVPKLRIKTYNDLLPTAVLGAPLSLYLKIRRQYPEIEIDSLDKKLRFVAVGIYLVFVAFMAYAE